MIKVLIADDHRMFMDGLKSLLIGYYTYQVVGEAENGFEVLAFFENSSADIVLMDVNMKEMDGITATRELKKKYPAVKVLMLTMFNNRETIEKVLQAGADGYILKNTGKEELCLAIDTVMSGRPFFSAEVTERIMAGLQGKKTTDDDPSLTALTEREKDVLRLIVQEMTSHEIADKLCISFNTVETHRKNLISKLPVKNTVGLVKYALENGIG